MFRLRADGDSEGKFVQDKLVYAPARLFMQKHYAEMVKCPHAVQMSRRMSITAMFAPRIQKGYDSRTHTPS